MSSKRTEPKKPPILEFNDIGGSQRGTEHIPSGIGAESARVSGRRTAVSTREARPTRRQNPRGSPQPGRIRGPSTTRTPPNPSPTEIGLPHYSVATSSPYQQSVQPPRYASGLSDSFVYGAPSRGPSMLDIQPFPANIPPDSFHGSPNDPGYSQNAYLFAPTGPYSQQTLGTQHQDSNPVTLTSVIASQNTFSSYVPPPGPPKSPQGTPTVRSIPPARNMFASPEDLRSAVTTDPEGVYKYLQKLNRDNRDLQQKLDKARQDYQSERRSHTENIARLSNAFNGLQGTVNGLQPQSSNGPANNQGSHGGEPSGSGQDDEEANRQDVDENGDDDDPFAALG
ncbi:hypothetical protein ACEPPN_003013 [Leptodophora sp. 'Broadleaf-Isolate-01']